MTGPDIDPSEETRWGLLVALYAGLIAGLPFLTRRGVDVAFARFPDAESVLLLLGLPALVGLGLVVGAVTVRQAWPAVLRDGDHIDLPVVARAAAIVTAIVLICAVPAASGVGISVIASVGLVSLVVALAEETLFRGLGLTVGRASGRTDRHIVVSTSIGFALVQVAHLVTEGATTFPIVLVIALTGPAMMMLRLSTGSLLVPVVVHALVLFGLSAGRFGPVPTMSTAFVVALAVVGVAAVAGMFAVRQLPAAESADRRWGRRIVTATAIVVAPVVGLTLVLVPSSDLGALPDPTGSYEEALAFYGEVSAIDDREPVYEPCRSQLLDHGRRTEQVVVLFHGLTNCPKQYLDFGREIFETGANVLILRAPRHGLASSYATIDEGVGSVEVVGRLTANELRDYADDAIDIATGLGDSVVVSGLSMGGVIATWVAQFRSDVDRVVAVAPAVSIPGVPHFLTTAFINLFNRVSNLSLPSSSKLDHTYHGESTGALGAMFLFAQATENESTTRPADVDEVIVVLNPTDDQVDNGHVRDLVDGWEDGDGVVEIQILPDIGLPHDVIDEDQPAGDVDVVYPILIPLIVDGLAAS
jgi:esterase/lipase